jgi:hypothetical protein
MTVALESFAFSPASACGGEPAQLLGGFKPPPGY